MQLKLTKLNICKSVVFHCTVKNTIQDKFVKGGYLAKDTGDSDLFTIKNKTKLLGHWCIFSVPINRHNTPV